jgi:acetyl esterase/lipase
MCKIILILSVIIGLQESTFARYYPLKNVKKYSDIVYATKDGKDLKLDLYVPKGQKDTPLLIWIHGGGWRVGSKDNINRAFLELVNKGFAIASIDYSLLGVPGILKITHECKGAVRFLRKNARKYGVNADKIGVGGSSAGGHLALLLGTSGGVKILEGDIGGNLDQSSRVQAVVDFFGPSDFSQMPKARLNNHSEFQKKWAEIVSPTTYVDSEDPPLIIYHGSKDKVVPVEQGILIDRMYREAKAESTLHIIKDAGHGFRRNQLPLDQASNEMTEFFKKHLKK